jgi:thioredoxin reductase (NADPH)
VIDDAVTDFVVGGVFIFIGFIPNTQLVDSHVEHDAGGYYTTDPMTMMTSIPGIFAAGDVRSQLTRQVTTAVGDATTATIAASKWVEEWHKGRPEVAMEILESASREGGWVA